MIFVTVGTHEQQFNRLIKAVDDLVADGIIKEEVVIQKGFSSYDPKHCKSYELVSSNEMKRLIEKARIIVTHGGPATFVAPLSVGKNPIVFPRKKEFGEHVNNHQVSFSKEVERRMKNILVVENEKELADAIINYDDIIKKLCPDMCSNTLRFNEKFQERINDMFDIVSEEAFYHG